MPKYALPVFDPKTNTPTEVCLCAASPADAAAAAAKVGWIVEADGTGARVLSHEPAAAPATEEGMHLAGTAALFAWLSLLFVPLAFVAIIMGGIAKERSKGVHGGGAQAAGVFILLLWLVIAVLVAAQ